MKSAFKHLLAVTAFVAAGAAQAQGIPFPPLLSSGSGTLAFSEAARGAFASAGVTLLAPGTIPAVAGLTLGGGTNAASYGANVLSLAFSEVTTSGDQISALSSPGSFLRLRRATVNDVGDVTALYSVYLTGFEFDLNASTPSTIYANVFAATNGAAVSSFGRVAIFTASELGIVGGTEGRVVSSNGADGVPQFTASGGFAGSLRLNESAGTLILSNLGLVNDPTGHVNQFWREANWGTVSFTAPAVPEPSTYALFGVGLLAVGALARRRQATA